MPASPETAALSVQEPSAGSMREVLTLAVPVVLTQLSTTLMGVVDSAMVGRLGPTELAAVGLGGVWLWTIFSLFFGTASGVQTFVAQEDGAGRPRACGAWTWQGLYAVGPASLLAAALVAPLVAPGLGLFGPSADLQEATASYVGARIVGEAGFTCTMLFSSFFRGIGDTRTPLYVTLLANALNALLDYGLIFGNFGLPAWGVAGAGVATAIAHWTATALLLGLLLRPSLRRRYRTAPARPSLRAMWRFLRTGGAIGGQWFVTMTTFATFTTMLARMGDDSMAASQAFVMLLSLSFMQAYGISIAASTLVGRYVGAGDEGAVRRSYAASMRLGLVLAAGVALLFVALPEALLRLFSDDPRVLELGRPLLLLGAIFQLFDAVTIITEGALRGAGDTRWPFWVGTAFGWGLFVPLSYTLGVVLGGGLVGAWVGALASLAASSSVLVWRFRSGAWRRLSI